MDRDEMLAKLEELTSAGARHDDALHRGPISDDLRECPGCHQLVLAKALTRLPDADEVDRLTYEFFRDRDKREDRERVEAEKQTREVLMQGSKDELLDWIRSRKGKK